MSTNLLEYISWTRKNRKSIKNSQILFISIFQKHLTLFLTQTSAMGFPLTCAGPQDSYLTNPYWWNFIRTQQWITTGEWPRSNTFSHFHRGINNIINAMPDVTIKLFAIDVYSCCNSNHNLQRAIDQLIVWRNTWQLKLASEKCCLFHIYSRSDKTHPCHFSRWIFGDPSDHSNNPI